VSEADIRETPHTKAQVEQPRPEGGRSDDIGPRLARVRRDRKLTLAQLAEMVGVSTSLISQIERGRSRPSITTLFGLAQALGVSVDAFFGEQPVTQSSARRTVTQAVVTRGGVHANDGRSELFDPPTAAYSRVDRSTGRDHQYVVRGNERRVIDIEGGVRWERLTPTSLSEFEFLELVYEPGGQSNPELYRHPGIEALLVLEGLFDITVGFETHRLRAGDTMMFPSSMPHRYVNPTDQESRAVTIILRDVGAEVTQAPAVRHDEGRTRPGQDGSEVPPSS
jgi:transcriptional regulator with XRE-family HTH domain